MIAAIEGIFEKDLVGHVLRDRQSSNTILAMFMYSKSELVVRKRVSSSPNSVNIFKLNVFFIQRIEARKNTWKPAF